MSDLPRRTLVFGWVLVVALAALLVIGYVILGGPAGQRPDRAEVAGTILHDRP